MEGNQKTGEAPPKDGEKRHSKGTGSSSLHNKEHEKHQDVYFIIPRTVTILYGPYMFQGLMDYRTERLQGMKTFLEKLGVTVNLTPCLDHVNLCRIWFLDELIFSCKLTDLMYGGDGELDPLCWEAAETLEKFIKKVLKGLRKQAPNVTPQQLKAPFCPCFQVDHSHDHHHRHSLGSETSGSGGSEESGSKKSSRKSRKGGKLSVDGGADSTGASARSRKTSGEEPQLTLK